MGNDKESEEYVELTLDALKVPSAALTKNLFAYIIKEIEVLNKAKEERKEKEEKEEKEEKKKEEPKVKKSVPSPTTQTNKSVVPQKVVSTSPTSTSTTKPKGNKIKDIFKKKK